MPPEYTGATIKYARDENTALMYLMKRKPEKDGTFVFKKGGFGKIVEIRQL